MKTTTSASRRKKGLFQLSLAACFIWLFMMYIGPALINAVPIWKQLGEEADRLNIHLASYFYTEVPISGEAEMHMRSTIRFQPGKQQAGYERKIPD